jgi:phage tail sheath protein FI
VGDIFNLTIRDTGTGVTEVFQNVTVIESPRRVDKVLANESALVLVVPSTTPLSVIPATTDPVTGTAPIPFSGPNLDAGAVAAVGGADGVFLDDDAFTGTGLQAAKQGLFSLDQIDVFNILCIPPHTLQDNDISDTLLTAALQYCESRRAIMVVDPPSGWSTKDRAKSGFEATSNPDISYRSTNGAVYFPRGQQPNPLHDSQIETFALSGAIAGVMSRTDAQRGVWKSPAGLDATLVNVPSLAVSLTDAENGELNPLGINCLRAFPAAGRVVWGARTLQGDDRLSSDWKYLSVRRLALFIEESLYRGTQWAVFEGNDETLWSQLRLNIGAFMNNLFRQGAFQGQTPKEAYFVKADSETTTQNDINLGVVNVLVGFAPLKPAEFVVIKLQQIAGQIAT